MAELSVRRFAIKAADLGAHPPTPTEYAQLQSRLKQVQSPPAPPSYSLLSERTLRELLEQRDAQLNRTESRYQMWVDNLEADLALARDEMVKLVDEKLALDDELMTVRQQRRELKAELANRERKVNEHIIQIQDLQHEVDSAQRQLRRYQDKAQDDTKNFDLFATNIKALQTSLAEERTNKAALDDELSSLKKSHSELRVAYEELEKETGSLRSRAIISDSAESASAIQNLALIILSKDKRNAGTLDAKTKQIAGQVFGDNFSKLIEAYESKLKESKDDNKELRTRMRAEAFELLESVGELQASVDLLIQVDRLLKLGHHETARELLEHHSSSDFIQQKTELESLIAEAQSTFSIAERQSLKSRNDLFKPPLYGAPPAEAQASVERLKTKLNAKTDENEKLMEKLRASQMAEADLRRQLDNKGSFLTGDMVASNADYLTFLQCGAAAVEELLNEQMHSLSGDLLDEV